MEIFALYARPQAWELWAAGLRDRGAKANSERPGRAEGLLQAVGPGRRGAVVGRSEVAGSGTGPASGAWSAESGDWASLDWASLESGVFCVESRVGGLGDSGVRCLESGVGGGSE